MQNEKAVKARVRKHLQALGAWYTMPYQAGMSQTGVPDFIVCYKGHFFAIETKSGKNKPTPRQLYQMDQIALAGGRCWVINEETMDMIPELLNELA